jgi:exopolyphosphatase/guanosine-5'-triphosphate,3'-diphosphate pyrophosphatase
MRILSVIEISSTAVEMIICQKNNTGIEILEKIEEELNLLKGVRKTKKISFEKSQKLYDILKKMKRLCLDYEVEKTIIITSSSLSNVENLPFILDQIKLQVGLDVIVSEVNERKKLRFKKFLKFENEMVEKRGNTLFLNINSSTSDLLLFNNGKLLLNETLPTGMYGFLDILEEENLTPEEVYTFLEEIIMEYLLEFKKEIARRRVTNLSFIGGMRTDIFYKFFGHDEIEDTSAANLLETMEMLRELSFNEIGIKYEMSILQAMQLFINASLLNIICNFFQVKFIKTLNYDAKEIIVEESFYPEKKEQIDNQIWKLTVESAKDLGIRYSLNKQHMSFILKTTKLFYKILYPYHAMDKKFEKYLELSAILQDIGKKIGLKEYYKHSAYLIKNSFIFGLTKEQINAVSFLVASTQMEGYIENFKTSGLDQREFVNFLKLAAILKISIALDKSKKQKILDLKLKIEENTLIIYIQTDKNFLVEIHAFSEQVDFLKKVFGINVRLDLNRRYHGNEI